MIRATIDLGSLTGPELRSLVGQVATARASVVAGDPFRVQAVFAPLVAAIGAEIDRRTDGAALADGPRLIVLPIAADADPRDVEMTRRYALARAITFRDTDAPDRVRAVWAEIAAAIAADRDEADRETRALRSLFGGRFGRVDP